MRERIRRIKVSLFPNFCQALCLIFIAARVFGFIDWSWYWLLSPMLVGPIALLGVKLIRTLAAIYIKRWERKHE